MERHKILTFTVMYFIQAWILGVDSKMVCLPLHDPKSNIPLDMAPDSVDDSYEGCEVQMFKKVLETYLPKERRKLSKNYSLAIQVYVNATANIYKSFNNATRTQYKSYNKTFKYHSLHFLLTNFTSNTLDKKIAKGFGSKSCFEIATYFGAPLGKYSQLAHENEVLIPPYEVFKITKVMKRKDKKDLWCDVVYKLKSTKKIRKSDLNCQMVRALQGE
uniref:NAD(P)(+)--arginine ADP-ribosyltransferase n=1 Tax=Hucho hucho TaxID=62062 RepID=A0A4W5MNL0_9TELE